MQAFHLSQNQMNYQNNRNKTTVKKQKHTMSRLIRFNQLNDKQNIQYQSNMINNQSKTILKKPLEYQLSQIPPCSNHSQKNSQFIVKIDNQQLSYCRKCATHIASQGFDVHKIVNVNNMNLKSPSQTRSSNTISNRISPNRSRTNSQLFQNQQKKKSELIQFTKNIKSLKVEYIKKKEYLTNVCQSYQTQKQTIQQYYNELMNCIQLMKQNHLQSINEEGRNTIQLCQIQKGQIRQTIQQIDQMVDDIQSNIQNIIYEIDQDNYIQCFSFYQQKQGIFSHRLEELGTDTKPLENTRIEQIDSKVQAFKILINDFHGVQDQDQQKIQEVQESYLY